MSSPARQFHQGQEVRFLDEDLSGRIVAVGPGHVLHVELEDGIVIQATPAQLVPVGNDPEPSSLAGGATKALAADPNASSTHPQSSDSPAREPIAEYRPEKGVRDRLRSKKLGGQKVKIARPPLEVDLHMESIAPDPKNLDPQDCLRLQMRRVKESVNGALHHNYPRLVLVHGVGEGILRDAIHRYLAQHPGVRSFGPASILEYGSGATEVSF